MLNREEPKLDVWCELRIKGQPDKLAAFIDWVDANLPEGWSKTDTIPGKSIRQHAYLLKAFGHAGFKVLDLAEDAI